MKTTRRFLAVFVVAGLLFLPAARAHAQPASTPSGPAATHGAQPAVPEHMDEPETNSDIEQYRHSPVVRAIARFAHLKTETAAQIFEDLNSAILLGAVAWFLFRLLPAMFRKRSGILQKELVEARLATENAHRRLAEVEERLLRLDSEIDALRKQVEQDSIEDEHRIHAALETERERIVASAEQEISATQAAAQRELKKFAADLAIDNAMRRVQLSAETDKTLVQEFGQTLSKSSGGEA